MVNTAVVGTGYWGKNLVRNFYNLPDANLRYCCDLKPEKLKALKAQYPGIKTTQDAQEVFSTKEIEAVIICTPAHTHYQLAREALLQGKNVYVEKPMTLEVGQAEELVDLAEKQGLILMVGHLMMYHPGVEKLKELIEQGELGEIYYLYSLRVNLGIIRPDENALWSFAPHDFSIIFYLLEQEPATISARGECYLMEEVPDVVFVNLHFPDKKMAQIQLSWLDPRKVRRMTVVGSRKMVVFDDVEPTEKIKIFDKGVDKAPQYSNYAEYLTLREGDIYIPRLEIPEPLQLECQHFLDCIKQNRSPRSDGRNGLQIVRFLEAAQRSMKNGGVPVKLS